MSVRLIDRELAEFISENYPGFQCTLTSTRPLSQSICLGSSKVAEFLLECEGDIDIRSVGLTTPFTMLEGNKDIHAKVQRYALKHDIDPNMFNRRQFGEVIEKMNNMDYHADGLQMLYYYPRNRLERIYRKENIVKIRMYNIINIRGGSITIRFAN